MTVQVVVLDYGSGNLRSAQRALERAGARVTVSSDADTAREAQALVVPGVGAFAACMAGIRGIGGDAVIRERISGGRPVLGICVGMQVLFTTGVEHGMRTDGLGHWAGTVAALEAPVLPHMGWNTVTSPPDSVLFRGLAGERFYFVHSYAVTRWSGAPARVSWAHHGVDFVAAVEDGVLAAAQFHPEKSGDAGIALLRNWLVSVD